MSIPISFFLYPAFHRFIVCFSAGLRLLLCLLCRLMSLHISHLTIQYHSFPHLVLHVLPVFLPLHCHTFNPTPVYSYNVWYACQHQNTPSLRVAACHACSTLPYSQQSPPNTHPHIHTHIPTVTDLLLGSHVCYRVSACVYVHAYIGRAVCVC